MSLNIPRYKTAQTIIPNNSLFWETLLSQSDIFAYNTVNQGKGGPFGAQLWLVNSKSNQYILVGSAENPEDSNAVLSKGRASAHAEAENLSPEKRLAIIRFLTKHQNEGWQIFQISSGESCPSCRSKQILFANELIQKKLLKKNDFYVLFKATYEQTKRDANFNDAPYDQTFRAIHKFAILNKQDGLINLESYLQNNLETKQQIALENLVYNPIRMIDKQHTPLNIKKILEGSLEQPTAIIANKNHEILSIGFDERSTVDELNHPEKTAIVDALYKAAKKLREEGKFESWNLEGAYLYTNIRDIGPVAYSESLWYNLSEIRIVKEFTSHIIDKIAQEMPNTENSHLFTQISADYDEALSPIQVIFCGNLEDSSVAHLLWKAKIAMEDLKNRQAERLEELEKAHKNTDIKYIDGTNAPLHNLILSSRNNSHYNGK